MKSNAFIDKIVSFLVSIMMFSITVLSQYVWGRYIYLIITICVALLYLFRSNGKFMLKADPYQCILLVFTLYTGFSAVWSLNRSDSLTMMTTLMSLLICYYPIYIYYDDYGSLDDFANAIKWGGIFASIYTIYFYGLNNLLLFTSTSRLPTDYANANTLGLYSATVILIQLWQALFKHAKKWKMFLCIPAIIVLAASQSRKALLFVFIAVFVLILLKSNENRNIFNKILNFSISILLILAIFYVIYRLGLFSGVAHRMEGFLNSFTQSDAVDNSTYVRNSLIELGIEWWKKYPILGVGIGAPHILAKEYVGMNAYLHNNYVELLCGGGFIGFLLYYSLHIYNLFNLFKSKHKKNELWILIFVWTLLIFVMDYGKVSYYSKLDHVYYLIISLSIKKIKRI